MPQPAPDMSVVFKALTYCFSNVSVIYLKCILEMDCFGGGFTTMKKIEM